MTNHNAPRFSPFLLPMAILAMATAHAAPIEGGTDKAQSENAELLKSVIKMDTGIFFEAATCTSTLISKNILLTARHCVQTLRAGDMIKLNDNDTYRVSAVVAQKDMTFQTSTDLVNTDIALVLFNAKDCSKSNLKDVNPVPLATQSNKSTLSNRVLIAGYGETAFGLGDAGTLHAGYNAWAMSDYSAVPEPKLIPILQQILRQIKKVGDNQLVLQGQRADIKWFENKKGESLAQQAFAASQIKEESAIDLPGDSGGPAIALNPQGQPFIVGVTSTVIPGVLPDPGKLVIADTNHNILTEIVIAGTEESMAEAHRTLLATLLKAKIVDSNYKVMVDFNFAYVKQRIDLGTYASTSNPINDVFIRDSLQKFEKLRDDAKNFCQ